MIAEIISPKIKRTRYLVSREFQLRYVTQILLLMFMTAALCSYVVYYTGMVALAEKLASVYPQGRLVAILNTVNLKILLSVIIVSPLVAIIGILLSHRIAGPIYRIELSLNKIASGDLTGRITLRQGDELVNVAERINNLTDSLKSTIGSQKSSLANILGEMESLKKVVESGSVNPALISTNINRLEKEVEKLEKQLGWYKV